MTNDNLRIIVEFYNELEATAGAKNFMRNCSSFGLIAGSIRCDLPSGLQYRIRKLIEDYHKELKNKQEEL